MNVKTKLNVNDNAYHLLHTSFRDVRCADCKGKKLLTSKVDTKKKGTCPFCRGAGTVAHFATAKWIIALRRIKVELIDITAERRRGKINVITRYHYSNGRRGLYRRSLIADEPNLFKFKKDALKECVRRNKLKKV